MEGTGANLRLPLNPPFFFESSVNYDRTTGAGTAASGFAGLVPGTTPTGQRARLRPEPAAAVHAAVERLRRVPADRRRCRRRSATSGTMPNHLVTPIEGNQALPGVGDPSHVGAEDHAPAALRARSRSSPPWRPTASRGGSRYNSLQSSVRQRMQHGLEFMASYTLAKAQHQQPRLLRRVRRHRAAGRDERHRGRVLAEHLQSRGGVGPGLPRRAPQLHAVGHVASCPSARAARWGSDWSALTDASLGGWRLGGIFQARTRPADHGHRRPRPLAAGRARRRAPELRRRPVAVATSRSPSGSTSPRSPRCRSARSATARSAWRGRPATRTSTWCCRSGSRSAAPRYAEFRVEAFNVFNHPELRPAGARHLGAEHVRRDHQHDQLAARDGAGVQVLLLKRPGYPPAVTPAGTARRLRRFRDWLRGGSRRPLFEHDDWREAVGDDPGQRDVPVAHLARPLADDLDGGPHLAVLDDRHGEQ